MSPSAVAHPASGPGLFRAHVVDDLEKLLPGQAGGIFVQLSREWVRLAGLPSVTSTLRRWAQAEPALLGIISLGGLLDRIDSSRGMEEDRLLLALVRLAQGGQQLAGRVLLQAMLPKLARMVGRLGPTSSDDCSVEDRRHIAVATFWEVLHAYPAERRRTTVAGNLALDTLHQLTSGRRKPPRDIPLDPEEVADRLSTDTLEDLGDVVDSLTADADLLDVIAWGVGAGVITAEEETLLVTLYLPDVGGGWCGTDLARELGLSHTALRKRCSRARRRLIAAVRADVAGGPVHELASSA